MYNIHFNTAVFSLPYLPEIQLHVVLGSLGLLLGLIPMLSRKGSPLHRKIGKAFAFLAAGVMLTAVYALLFRHKANLEVLNRISLAATYLLFSGMRALKMKRHGPNWLDNAMAFGCLIAVSILMLSPSQASHIPVAALNFSLIWVATVASYDLSRNFWRANWCQNYANLDHGIKMIAVFFAMLSAGAGNLLSAYQPWSIVLPNVLGALCMLGYKTYYLRGVRSKPSQMELANA